MRNWLAAVLGCLVASAATGAAAETSAAGSFPTIQPALRATPGATADSPWRARSREMLAEAVELRTVEGREAETVRLAERLAARFRAAGFPAGDVEIRMTGAAPTLLVRYRAGRRTDRRPILLLGHLDVVDALESDWTLPPFSLTERDGYFYGRGVIDNKCGVISIAAALMRLKEQGFRPRRDIVVAFTGDEETTGESAKALSTRWLADIRPEFALNSDAGGGAAAADGRLLGFGLQTSEKTYATFTLTVRNPGGHSSLPRPDNAIYELAAALSRIAAYRFEPQINDTTRAAFLAEAGQAGGPLADAMRRFAADPSDRAAADLIEADPGHIGTTRTTCVATRLAAGHADNALPGTATATVNCRIFPGGEIPAVQARLLEVAAQPKLEIALKGDLTPATPASPLRADVLRAYQRAVRARYPGAEIAPQMSMGATDGSFLRAAGVPVYGVGGEWIVTPADDRAHGRDERLPVRAFYESVDHWMMMMRDLAG